jgi:hypothetical protein
MTSNEPFRSSTSIFQPKKNKRVFERFDPAYSILARTLTARRDNLIVTVADLWSTSPRDHCGNPRCHPRGGLDEASRLPL